MTQHRLYNVPLSRFGFLLTWLRMKTCNAVTTPRIPSCKARFPWKNVRSQGAVGLITCKSQAPQCKTHCLRKHEEREPKECSRIPARCICFGKRQGICIFLNLCCAHRDDCSRLCECTIGTIVRNPHFTSEAKVEPATTTQSHNTKDPTQTKQIQKQTTRTLASLCNNNEW